MDKTGTLTAIQMLFKNYPLCRQVFEVGHNPNAGATILRDLEEAMQAGSESRAVCKFSVPEFEDADMAFCPLAICDSVVAEHIQTNDHASEHNMDGSSKNSSVTCR